MAELGDTTDARQLVPGDPDAIEHDVTAVHTRGPDHGTRRAEPQADRHRRVDR